MLTKNDCLLLLLGIEGEEAKKMANEVARTGKLTSQIIKFINDERPLDLAKFYEKIRHSYNQKKSSLYINIVKETDDTTDVLTTLSAMALQILLFGKNVEDKMMFFRQARLAEIYKALHDYATTGDIIPCQKLLRVIKADIKMLELATR